MFLRNVLFDSHTEIAFNSNFQVLNYVEHTSHRTQRTESGTSTTNMPPETIRFGLISNVNCEKDKIKRIPQTINTAVLSSTVVNYLTKAASLALARSEPRTQCKNG